MTSFVNDSFANEYQIYRKSFADRAHMQMSHHNSFSNEYLLVYMALTCNAECGGGYASNLVAMVLQEQWICGLSLCSPKCRKIKGKSVVLPPVQLYVALAIIPTSIMP